VHISTNWHYLEGDERQYMAMQSMSQLIELREMDDVLWEGHTLLKTGLSAHRHTHRQTDRQTKVKTVYLPVSLH